MTAVVVARRPNGYLLVGYNGKWLRDNPAYAAAVRADEDIGAVNSMQAEEAVEDRHYKWQEAVGEPVKYTLKQKDGVWSAVFFTKDKGRLGFPKGGLEAGETPRQAAVREFAEETGFRVEEVRMVPSWSGMDSRGKPVYAFTLTLSDSEADAVAVAWKRLGHESELFDLEWMAPKQVRTRKLNEHSWLALTRPRRAGTRRRFTRKTRRNRK